MSLSCPDNRCVSHSSSALFERSLPASPSPTLLNTYFGGDLVAWCDYTHAHWDISWTRCHEASTTTSCPVESAYLDTIDKKTKTSSIEDDDLYNAS